MTYNEWRDELKKNLLSVSERERQRVLDYYAEAYADRRDAGLSERQIIEDFGAPYDAAQRILLNIYDNSDNETYSNKYDNENENLDKKFNRKHFKNEEKEKQAPVVDAEIVSENKSYNAPKRKNYGWVFVLLCVIFSIPLFVLFMALLGVSFGLIISPAALLIAGIGSIIIGIIEIFGNFVNGLYTIGEGLISLGIGIVLMPLLFKLVKLMWKLIKRFFNWLSSLFSGKEYVK